MAETGINLVIRSENIVIDFFIKKLNDEIMVTDITLKNFH